MAKYYMENLWTDPNYSVIYIFVDYLKKRCHSVAEIITSTMLSATFRVGEMISASEAVFVNFRRIQSLWFEANFIWCYSALEAALSKFKSFFKSPH